MVEVRQEETRRRGDEEEEEATDIKSNNPHLAGGEKLNQHPTGPLDFGSVDIVKGWTRSTVVATILAACAELDIQEEKNAELLKPLFPVLDKCWLIPVHVSGLCHVIHVMCMPC